MVTSSTFTPSLEPVSPPFWRRQNLKVALDSLHQSNRISRRRVPAQIGVAQFGDSVRSNSGVSVGLGVAVQSRACYCGTGMHTGAVRSLSCGDRVLLIDHVRQDDKSACL
eukprot:Sro239_g095821.2  (110) ;mRNA; f:26932-27346